MKIRFTIAVLLLSVAAVPAVAQNRFMDQAKEAAQRRAENKAIREMENPETVAKPAAAPAAPAAPAEPATPPPAPVAPAAAAPAAPAPAQ